MDTIVQDRGEQVRAEFRQRLGGPNSIDTADSLWRGLTTLKKLLLTRLHNDVEAQFGIDTIRAPSTSNEARREIGNAVGEIEIYSAVVVLAEAAHSGYAKADFSWFCQWLTRLFWGESPEAVVLERLHAYDQLTDGERRRMFASHVERALPEATSAPLVIYRLYPRTVRIATALAFGDRLRASDIRNEQIAYLPVISDCHECHGAPLDNGEVCSQCGNPLWKLNWMNATD
jgi:hypothetical protein